MSGFYDLCLRRQSCRNFSNRPVERDKLVKCVDAARLAPSACNSQPWSFIVVQTPDKVAETAKCAQQMGINAFASKAGAFIIIMEEHARLMPAIRSMLDSQYFAKGDLGAATEHVCLAAADQDLGTCILGLFDRDRLRELFNIPVDKRFAALIAVGYPADDVVREKSRKALDDIVRFE